ncbi:MAG: hypothetical protein WC974_03490 [Thermoplasmata archaeon]
MNYCPMCGNKFVHGAMFCHQCGYKKLATEVTAPHPDVIKKITKDTMSIPHTTIQTEPIKKQVQDIQITRPVVTHTVPTRPITTRSVTHQVSVPVTKPPQPAAPAVTPDGKRICPECNGRGVVWEHLATACDYCQGSGKCNECEGTGVCEYCKTTQTCEVCGGSKVCYRCHGAGKCRECNGSGKEKGREYKCGLCGGLGKI